MYRAQSERLQQQRSHCTNREKKKIRGGIALGYLKIISLADLSKSSLSLSFSLEALCTQFLCSLLDFFYENETHDSMHKHMVHCTLIEAIGGAKMMYTVYHEASFAKIG